MPKCHFKICGALVFDGTGSVGRHADVAVEGDRVVEVGQCDHWQAEESVDASGLALAPGFIDVHTHDDLALVKTPALPFKVSQGVTTVITGNCGISAAPLSISAELPAPFPLLGEQPEFKFPSVEHYKDAIDASPATVNVAMLTGHSSLRLGAMTDGLTRAANPAEMNDMQESLRRAIRQGSIGLSSGLDYPPATSAPAMEMTGLASVLAEFDGAVYATHMRNESDQVLEAVRETLETGRTANVPVVISHHKCAGPDNYGRSVETLAAIDQARLAGQDVMVDVYPYTASSTSLLPKFVKDAETVLVIESTPYPQFNGMMLDRIAGQWKCDASEAAERLYPASAIYFQMDQGDLERILSHPAAMIGSDGLPTMKNPHPRLWGTFPRVLGRYVREKKLLRLEKAVHKMTGLSAKTFGLEHRGEIGPGKFADLVLFEPDRIIDTASYESPNQPAAGIRSVWVNGQVAWHDCAGNPSRHGRFLCHRERR